MRRVMLTMQCVVCSGEEGGRLAVPVAGCEREGQEDRGLAG